MANIRSQIRRNRQNEKRRLRNRVYRGGARTFISKARVALESSNKEEAAEAVRLAVKALDKAAEKGVIHRNNASRRKGRLMKQLAQMEK